MSAGRSALLALALGAACSAERVASLDLGLDRSALGLFCAPPGEDPLIASAVDADGVLHLALVFDVMAVGPDVPSCRPEKLRTACNERVDPSTGAPGCPPILPQRRCVDLAIADVPGSSIDDKRAHLLDALRAEPAIFTDAPDEPVVVRMIAIDTSDPSRFAAPDDPCGSIAATPLATVVDVDGADSDLDLVVGCMTSCPVLLDTVASVALSLDVIDETACGDAIRQCVRHFTE